MKIKKSEKIEDKHKHTIDMDFRAQITIFINNCLKGCCGYFSLEKSIHIPFRFQLFTYFGISFTLHTQTFCFFFHSINETKTI